MEDVDTKAGDVGGLISKILLASSLRPAGAMVVGDRKEDIVAGRSNMVRTVGVTYGYGSREEIVNSYPDYVCNNPREIYAVITEKFF